MELTINEPTLFFPAISLLLLAYTNRYLGISTVIRNLHRDYQEAPDPKILRQIANLRHRTHLIRQMQSMGVASLLLCMVCMFVVWAGWQQTALAVFAISLVCMVVSMLLSLQETRMSTDALNILLEDMEVDLIQHEQSFWNLTDKRVDRRKRKTDKRDTNSPPTI